MRTIAISALAGAALAATGAVTATRWYYRAEIANMQRDRAQQLADATQLARMTEQARWAAREGVINDAKKQAAAAAADANTARAASERLRQQIAQLQRRARDAATAGGSQAAGDPIGVLAVVLGELDDRAGVLAKYADASRIAGLACERAYQSLR
ncbi:DUF2514 family protein [Castellaniella sp. UC4442_H9]